MRLFFDINVILDVLAARDPWVEDSGAVLSFVDDPNVEGFLAAHSVTTLSYLVSKQLGRQEAVVVLLDLLEHLSVTALDEELLLKALSLGWVDVEDAVQAISAQRARADYLVTRNPADFSSFSVEVVTPSELRALLESDAP